MDAPAPLPGWTLPAACCQGRWWVPNRLICIQKRLWHASQIPGAGASKS